MTLETQLELFSEDVDLGGKAINLDEMVRIGNEKLKNSKVEMLLGTGALVLGSTLLYNYINDNLDGFHFLMAGSLVTFGGGFQLYSSLKEYLNSKKHLKKGYKHFTKTLGDYTLVTN